MHVSNMCMLSIPPTSSESPCAYDYKPPNDLSISQMALGMRRDLNKALRYFQLASHGGEIHQIILLVGKNVFHLILHS